MTVISMRICRIARSLHPIRMSVFLMKYDAYSWREIFSTREKLEKLLRINHEISTLAILKRSCDEITNNAV